MFRRMLPMTDAAGHDLLPLLALCFVVGLNSAAAQSIVAHRGASRDAPENTLAAFRLAWDRNADAIEGDFRLTADRQIVCIHDRDTGRVARQKLVVSDSTLAQLTAVDVGRWKGRRWAGERIPTLSQVLQTVPRGKRILIEIKCGPEIVPVLKSELDSRWSGIEPVIISFDQEVIFHCKRQLPQIKAYWLARFQRNKATGMWEPGIDHILATLKRIGADGLDCQAEPAACTPQLIGRVRQAGGEFHCWTVNDPDLALTFSERGVDSITTDRPRYLRRHLPSCDLKQHLQLHLGFEGQVADDSRFRRTVQLKGPAIEDPQQYPTAVFGRGLQLSGQQFVSVDYRLPETGGLCMWYWAHRWYDYQTIFDQPRHRNAWEMWIDQHARLKFRLTPQQKQPLYHRFHPVGHRNGWQHIGLTWSRDESGDTAVRLFVNARVSESMTLRAADWVPIGERLHLGGGHPGNTRADGIMDDVFVWDCPLKSGDIHRLMRLGKRGLVD